MFPTFAELNNTANSIRSKLAACNDANEAFTLTEELATVEKDMAWARTVENLSILEEG